MNGVPAASFASVDWLKGMVFRFDDPRQALPVVSFCAPTAAGACESIDSIQSQPGRWNLVWDTAPHEVRAALVDPFGLSATYHITLAPGPAGTTPVNVELALANGETVLRDWSAALPAVHWVPS